jgi:hypothetical protein
MKQTTIVAGLAGAAVLALCGAAQASTVWDESLDGDFSNNGLTPTALDLVAGSNVVRGTTGNSGQGIDRDYFRFTVPDGASLTGIAILTSTTISGGASFIGIQAGPQLTVGTLGEGAAALLGYTHYSNDQVGTDILPVLVFGQHALGSGTYSLWVQETGGPVSYGFDFSLTPTPVPLPAGIMLLASGLAGLFGLRKSHRLIPGLASAAA